MLQRQIMFKQLQELQRRQQLQELSNTRNPSYANGMSVQDSSRMFLLGNMQMMQHGGSDGLLVSQNNNHDVGPAGPSHPQFDVSLKGTHASSSHKNFLNQYSHLQGPSKLSGSSFLSQQCNVYSDQISTPDGPLLFNQEKNLFVQGPFEGCNNSGIFAEKTSNLCPSESATSLDPLEQKILYNTDDNSFESTVEHISIQSGSWSALMQSAVAETSSGDTTGIQEEWSGLSFPNREPLNDNQPSNYIDSEKLQNNWVDRKTSHLADYHSQQERPAGGSQQIQTSLPSQNSWPGQHKEQWSNDAYHQPCNNYSGDELRGAFWLQGSGASHDVLGDIQKANDQVNQKVDQLNNQGYSLETENMAPGKNVEAMSTLMGTASLDHHSENMNAPSESMLGPADPHTPQSYSFFPSLSMGTSSGTSPSSHNVNDYTRNQLPAPAGMLQNVGFPTGLSPNMPAQQDVSSPEPHKFSSNLFQSPDSASSCVEASSGAPNVHQKLNSFQHGYNYQELGKYSLHEGSTEINNSTSLSRSIHKQEFTRQQAEAVGSDALMANMQKQPYTQPLGQTYSLLHSARNVQTDGGNSCPPKHDNFNFQQSIANARELFLNGQKYGVKERAKSDLHKGSNFSHENFQQMDMFCQNNTQSHPVGNYEASNLTYHSQISLQMAPSWFKHYVTFKNGQMLPMYDPKGAVNARQPLSETTLENMQDNSLANASQESGLCPSTAATSIACQQLNPPCVLPSDISRQNLAVSIPKKRKLVEIDVIPWHKEVNHGQSRLQDISTAELVWAQALSSRQDEVKNEADIGEELLPVVRAKRRLIYTTQLVQQVFRPAPAVTLCSDASSDCDYVAYFAARLALGDACSSTGQLPSDTNDVSPDKLKTLKKTNVSKFSKVVEGFIDRVNKLECDSSRLEKSLCLVDIKIESQDLEKFSIINRFGKFHVKALPSTVDPLSSGISTMLHRSIPQKYVVAVPLPKILPEGMDCLSL